MTIQVTDWLVHKTKTTLVKDCLAYETTTEAKDSLAYKKQTTR